MSPEAYKRTCSEFYIRQAYLDNWVDRVQDPDTGAVVYKVYPYTTRKTNKLAGRGRTTYIISTGLAEDSTTRMPPPSPGSISELDFEGDGTHVDALLGCTLYMLGSAQGVSDRSDPWSVYNLSLIHI